MTVKQGLAVGVVAAALVAAAAMGASGRLPGLSGGGAKFIQASSAMPMFAPPPGAPTSFADIFERVSPAVVSINVTSRVDASDLQQFQFLNPFGNNGRGGRGQGQGQDGQDQGQGQGQGGRAPQTPAPRGGRGGGGNSDNGDATGPSLRGAGSGFLISADGYIVTNNHVVEDADAITVTMSDGRKLKARVVGSDEYTDLAVIKIDGGRFPFVNFESQAKPRVGDWVITVGNPFDLGGSATAGIVSAFGRNNLGGSGQDLTSAYVDYIQIDAPINRGNSGGPTFDVYGRVIGVNSVILSPSGGSVGIGFAIPADIAESIAKQLIANGKVTRGYIGASVGDFTVEDAEALGLGAQRGALVASVVCNGPAAKSGLQGKDIVISVNGVDIKGSSELTREVAKVSPGGQIRLVLLRDGVRRNLNVTSGTRPGSTQLSADSDDDTCVTATAASNASGGPAPAAAAPRVLGMELRANDNGPGLVVAAIRADSDAYEKGLGRGDVITDINLRPVATVKDVTDAVAEAKRTGRPSVILSLRGGGRVTVRVE